MSFPRAEASATALASLHALASAFDELSSVAIDVDGALSLAVRRTAEALGDAAIATLLTHDKQWLRHAAVFHPDPELARDYEAMLAATPARAGDGFAGRVISSGSPLLVSEVDHAELLARIRPEWRDVIRRLDIGALSIVPMRAGAEVIGALSSFRARPAVAYEPEEQLAQQTLADALGRALAHVKATPVVTVQPSRPDTWTALHLLFDAMPQLGWTARPDGFIDYYNRRWYDYTGTSYEQMRGWGWQSVHDPAELPRVMEHWRRSLETKQPFEQEFPLRGKDGAFRWFLTRVVPIFDAGGGLERWVGINTDIDDLRREREARETLVRSSASLGSSLDYADTLSSIVRAALPALGDLCTLYMQAADGKIELAASAHVDADKLELLRAPHLDPDLPYGYPQVIRTGESELVGNVDAAFLAAAARSPTHLSAMQQVGARSLMIVPLGIPGKVFGALAFAVTRGSRPYDKRDLAVAEELGRRAGLVIENARLFGEAQRASRAKDEFLAMLGHELRNPLSPIMTGLQLMRMRGTESSREIDAIERQAQHLVRLVDDLLDVSRIATGKVVLDLQKVELAEVVGAALETASPLIDVARHRVSVEVPERGLLVRVDRGRMAQVLSNLLTNAAKYTPPGGSLSVTAQEREAEVVLEVADSGSGIAPDLLPRIFELFVQARQTVDRSQGGLGLGLSIVKSLVTAHGGRVEAHSDGVGRGSVFRVTLPLAEGRAAASSSPLPATSAASASQRVLVVDDYQNGADMLAEGLELLGYQTAVAHDPVRALQVAREFAPHVALLDIGLPIMDGYELGRRLRDELGPQIILIAVSGYGQDVDRQRSLAEGLSAHVTKPIDLGAIHRLLSEKLGAASRSA